MKDLNATKGVQTSEHHVKHAQYRLLVRKCKVSQRDGTRDLREWLKPEKPDNTKCRWSPWNSRSPLVRVQPGTVILRQFGISLESETQTHLRPSNPSPTHSPNEAGGRPQMFTAASLVICSEQALSTGERRNKLRRGHPQRNTIRWQKGRSY